MKRFFRFVMAAAVIFSAVSCAKEDISSSIGGGEVEVTFTANLADMGTRAIGDGTTVNQVYLAVYEADGNKPLEVIDPSKPNLVQGKKATIRVALLKDKVYDLVFWAQSSDAPDNCYTPNWVGRTLTVNYTDAVAQDENRDAFFLVKNGFRAGHDETVFELRRPFAQLNVGLSAEDVENIGKNGVKVNKLQAEVTVNKVFSTLKLTADSVDADGKQVIEADDATTAIFTMADKPSEKLKVSGVEYEYLSMNYLLANQNVEVNYTFSDGATQYFRNYYAVPLKYNYRTNIIGNILSAEYDFNVIIVPGFNEPDEEVAVWDGSISQPSVNANGEYEIAEPSELAWLAAAVNGTLPANTRAEETLPADSFAGKTFILTDNINLGGQEWTPIGTSANPFKGTFDGKDKTIYDLMVNGGKDSNVGLFGYTTDGEIKNLTIQNAKVSGRLNVAVVAGTPYTSKYTNITVKGHVEVNGMAYVGAVGGKNAYADWTNITVEADETSYVKANSVENGTAYRTYVGGVCGFNGEGGHSFKNITSNINVEGSTCDVGGLFGIAHYGNKFVKCVCTGNVTITTDEAENALEMGGIAGVWHNETGYTVTMTDCSFTGKLSTPNITEEVAFYYGGLVGAPYSPTGTGKLIIDGKQYVANATQLQAALNAATGESTIYLGADIEGDVTVVQKPDVKITIDGNNHNYNGVITVDGKSAAYDTAALTIKNVNFNGENISADACIRLGNGENATRYTSKVTVDNCTFDVPGAVGVKSYTGGDKNLQILNSTAKANAHSLLQAKGIDEILVKECEVYSKNGLNFNNSDNVTVEQCKVAVKGYAVRYGESSGGVGAAEKYWIKNSSLESDCEDGDAVIILRGTADYATLNIENTTLDGAIQIANNAKDAKVIIGGVSVISSAEALQSALANAKAGDTLTLAPAIIEGTFKPVVENLIIKSVNENSKATIKGRVNIDGYGSGIKFENIKFDINSASGAKNTFTGANYKYPAIVTIYAAATNFDGCEFKCDLNTGICGINYGSHTANKPLSVNNCTFNGDFYAIRTRTLFNITNNKFNVYTSAGKLAAVWTWGNGEAGTKNDGGANSVVFTGNTNLSGSEVYGVQLQSTTFNYCHISYNFQGNTGFTTLANSCNSNCDYTGSTFADGSETF